MVLACPASSNSGSGKASFTAALNMELSDGWVLTENNGNFDPNARGAHTHHVTLSMSMSRGWRMDFS